MVTYQDWRDVPAEVVRPLYEAECARWQQALAWDYRPSCDAIESARCQRRLPGLLALGRDGGVVGWSYFVLHAGRLHVGALVSRRRLVARGLLGSILRSREARAASGISCFLYSQIPLDHALARYRFHVNHHAYLSRDLASDEAPDAPARACVGEDDRCRIAGWSRLRLADVAVMFASAYEGMAESRCFTNANRVAEWLVYLAHIDSGAVCGRFSDRLSALAEADDGSVAGAVITTELAPGTIHIAQVAVAREHRGRGVAERLVRRACADARRAGYERVTLLVAHTNSVARRLYERLGFSERDQFVFAYRDRRAS